MATQARLATLLLAMAMAVNHLHTSHVGEHVEVLQNQIQTVQISIHTTCHLEERLRCHATVSPDPLLTALLCPPARRARPRSTLADDDYVYTALRSGTATQSSEARSAAWMMRT